MSATPGPVAPTKSHHASQKLHHLREKLKHTRLYDAKIHAVHLKNKIGKLENLVNPNHRHDEEHEKRTDAKRGGIQEGHRFGSWAPVRDAEEGRVGQGTEGCGAKWYVDGRDYFWAVSVALERAKETIYIADWWLSPELFLRRPPYFNQEWRLDRILKRRAEDGVKIFVIVYKEVSQALTCNSAHTKHALMSLCPEGSPGHGNILCMRHPDHNVFENAGDMTFYWAHHEKLIVVDYELAFVGGLDLCFGRWDMHQHPLSDVHPRGVEHEVWLGQDFNNNRIMDFENVEDWENNELSKAEHGRMPWHDVAIGVQGWAVYDIAEHFVLRWNFCKRDKYKRDERYPWLELEGRLREDEDLVGVQRPRFPVGGYEKHPLSPLSSKPLYNMGTVTAQVVRSSADWSSGILTEHSIQNAYCELIRNAEHYVYIENQFFITATGGSQSPIHNEIGTAIVEACVRAGKEGRKFRVIILIPAIPGFAGDLRGDAAAGTRAIMDYQYRTICRGEHSIMEQIRSQGVDPKKYIFVFNLRSYDRLNTTSAMQDQESMSGVKYREVQRAHAEEIMGTGIRGVRGGSSSSEGGRDSDLGDGGPEALADRKRQFESLRGATGIRHRGEVVSVDSVAKDAMLDGRRMSDEPWDEQHREEEKGNFVQEELYIHAKVLIVDDKHIICGSSNINDRSQLGFHDSELSIILTDTKSLESRMDGKPYTARHLATTLRRTLWMEHLGLLPSQPLDASEDPNAQPPTEGPNHCHEGPEWDFVADPLSDELWARWCESATTNTEVFRTIFHADPDDGIKDWKDYENFLPDKHGKSKYRQGHVYDTNKSSEEIRRQLDSVKGHLVWMPLCFLEKVDMAERGLQVNEWTESIYT